MQTSEDTSVYDKVVNAIFDEEMIGIKNHHQNVGRLRMFQHDTSSIQFADLDTELRDYVAEVSREVFKQHCARHLEIVPMRLLDDCPKFYRFFSWLNPCFYFLVKRYRWLILFGFYYKEYCQTSD